MLTFAMIYTFLCRIFFPLNFVVFCWNICNFFVKNPFPCQPSTTKQPTNQKINRPSLQATNQPPNLFCIPPTNLYLHIQFGCFWFSRREIRRLQLISKPIQPFPFNSFLLCLYVYSWASLERISRDWAKLCLIVKLPYCIYSIILTTKSFMEQ